jgi:uncharacterized protein (TIGR02391 family)
MQLAMRCAILRSMTSGPFQNLFAAYPTGEAWEAADPEDMGPVLLRDLKSQSASNNLCLNNLHGPLQDHFSRERGRYPTDPEIAVFFEAYHWLRNVGLLAPSPRQSRDFDVLTRRALALDDVGLTQFRAARLSGYEILDSGITNKVWSIYLRGDYDIAIAYAFKVVEMRMREKAGLTNNDMGERLAKKFFERFSSEAPRKSEKALPSVVQLFIGALDRYRNSAVHERPSITEPEEAMEVMLLANHCLRIVERST